MEGMSLRVDFRIDNPYPVGITIEEIEISAAVEGNSLFQSVTADRFTVPSNGTWTNSFDVFLNYQDLASAVSTYMTADSFELTADAEITIALPALPGLPPRYTVSLATAKRLPAFRPEIQVVNLRLDLPSRTAIAEALLTAGRNPLSAARVIAFLAGQSSPQAEQDLRNIDIEFGFGFDIELSSAGGAPFAISAASYTVELNGIDFVRGVSGEPRNEGTRSTLPVNNRLSTRNSADILVSLVTRREISFDTTGSVSIDLGGEFTEGPLSLTIGNTGSTAAYP